MATLTVAEVLNRAADLIEPEGAWTQRGYAKTASGRLIGPLEEPAVCWCAIGAIIRASGEEFSDAEYALRDFLAGPASEFNDAPERQQAEVVAALRAAALKAGAPA